MGVYLGLYFSLRKELVPLHHHQSGRQQAHHSSMHPHRHPHKPHQLPPIHVFVPHINFSLHNSSAHPAPPTLRARGELGESYRIVGGKIICGDCLQVGGMLYSKFYRFCTLSRGIDVLWPRSQGVWPAR